MYIVEEMNMLNEWRAFAEALVVALVGVAIFSFMNIPLPWLIGSLVTVAVWRIITQRELYWPFTFRKIAMVLLGYLIGTSFTEDTLVEMGEHVPSMIAVTVLTIGFSLLLGYIFSKITGLDLTSCVIGSVPGGLSQIMVLMDEIKGVNPTVIMFLQSMRVMVIVIVLPIVTVYIFGGDSSAVAPSGMGNGSINWLDMPWYTYFLYPLLMVAGAWLFYRLRVPTALLLGPMVLTIVMTFVGFPTPELPVGFIDLAQIFIGVHIGLQMQPRDLPNWRKVTAYTGVTVVVLVLFGLGLGYGLAFLYELPFTTALLSTAPGGMVEMGLTAVAIGGDVSVVTSYQLFRLLIIMSFVPFFFKWLARKQTDD
ncbi:AbrB family transcriptional regulator [Lentibacillus sp. CBA3610]|uniref:AbrB family transcriptional regulator n=1 Tax=Lentibacillus sp. CBA3610 TaxID=2518176 RepID=UPI0015959225|nr:AbrB family transcriptional regulator [Lentibacillus sp. CBA3610]QKY70685.1 AbrB family transcriptional regulator [Lentibacillus sp. CBA3610]